MSKQLIVNMFKDIGIKLNHDMITKPKNSDYGDLSCSIAFSLAKEQKNKPVIIAQEVYNQLSTIKLAPIFSHISVTGPYINFHYSKTNLAHSLFSLISNKGQDWAQSKKESEKTYLVEYFQPNTHKGVHVGHLRNGFLGESVSRILRYCGSEVKQVLYIGDIGAHVAKWIWFYKKYPEKVKKIREKEPKNWIGEVYAESTRHSDDTTAKSEINNILVKLEENDPELLSLWERTRNDSLQDILDISKKFQLHYEKIYFESEVQDPGKEIVDKFLAEGIAEVDDGAPIINFEKRGIKLTNFLLRKSDGSSLYATKDLALAFKKKDDFEFDESVFVIAIDQNLYIKQLFQTLKIVDYPKINKHLAYELIVLSEGKMSSRYGTVVLFHDLYEKMFSYISNEIRTRNPEISDKLLNETADILVLGAMKFSMLNANIRRKIVFDYVQAMRFDGKTATYVQYTTLRANKILENNAESSFEIDINNANLELLSDIDFQLLKKINETQDIIISAAKKMDPVSITEFVFELCQLFNVFYNQRKIISEKDIALKTTLLFVVQIFRETSTKLLNLLAIDIPEVM